MAIAAKKSAPQWVWPVELAGGAVFVGLIIIIGLAISHHPSSTTTTKVSRPTMSSTPESYSDCIGTVNTVGDKDLSVVFKGQAASGTLFTKTFHVIVDKSTDIKSETMVKGQRVFSALQLNQIHAGDTVFIAAATNIAPITEFTATKVYLYQPTS